MRNYSLFFSLIFCTNLVFSLPTNITASTSSGATSSDLNNDEDIKADHAIAKEDLEDSKLTPAMADDVDMGSGVIEKETEEEKNFNPDKSEEDKNIVDDERAEKIHPDAGIDVGGDIKEHQNVGIDTGADVDDSKIPD